MKGKFLERITQALTLKINEYESLFHDRFMRIIEEYDEDFSIAFKIKDSGLRFVVSRDRMLLDDTVNKRYPFVYNRRKKAFDSIMEEDECFDIILEYLQIADGFNDKSDEIMKGIEKRLDILSGILTGKMVRPVQVRTEPRQEKPSQPILNIPIREEVQEAQEVPMEKDNADRDDDYSEDFVYTKNMESARRAVAQANGDYAKAIKVLQTLNFSETEWAEAGIPQSFIDDYVSLKK